MRDIASTHYDLVTPYGAEKVASGKAHYRTAPCHCLNQCWQIIMWFCGIQSARESVPETLGWLLHSAEEDNLSPFDSKNASLCQSIKINNSRRVYRQSQVRKVFNLLLVSSVGLSADIQSAGDSVRETLGPTSAFGRGRQSVSFHFENRLTVPKHQN